MTGMLVRALKKKPVVIPKVRSSIVAVTSGTASSVFTCSLPAGAAVDDLLIIHFAIRRASVVPVVNTPAGWNLVVNNVVGNQVNAMFWKIRTNENSVAVQTTTSVASGAILTVLALTDFNMAQPIIPASVKTITGSASASSISLAAFDSYANTLGLFASISNPTTTSNGAHTHNNGKTKLQDNSSANSATFVRSSIAVREQLTAVNQIETTSIAVASVQRMMMGCSVAAAA